MRRLVRFLPVLILLITTLSYGQNTGIKLDSTGLKPNPVSSAIIEVSSQTKGALLPRMTSAEKMAIENPEEGLTVYQTDGSQSGYWVYNGTSWQALGEKGQDGADGADGKDWDHDLRIGEKDGWYNDEFDSPLIFIKYGNLDGEVEVPDYEGYSALASYSLKEMLTISRTPVGFNHKNPARVEMDLLLISDRTIPELFRFYLEGVFTNQVWVEYRVNTGEDFLYLKHLLEDVRITNFEQLSKNGIENLTKLTISAERMTISCEDSSDVLESENWVYQDF
ncbi:hypothetical protein [Jiulongibacter sp. NS-SX5]|uniref:hypothetical protein n=1 Tax=Jiulongibacter sp. NS-SX5 TaxID=3463854 RepID=UPI004059C216